MILVTGATGNIGAELVKRLSGGKQAVRAFVHSRARAQAIALPGIELVEGDFNKPETFTRALDRVDRLFLLIPSSAQVEQQQRNFVDAAKRANVRHIVKLSQFAADKHALGRFQRYHAVVERHILNSGIPHTFLRPNLFMQGLLNFRSTISSQGAFVPPAAMREALLGFGMSAWQADGLVEDYDHYRRGEATAVTSTVRDLTGKEATPFTQFAKDYAGSFLSRATGTA